jgi:hypothetical protein
MSEQDQGRDLRDSPRREFTVSLEVKWREGQFTCTTVDISLTGLFLETEEPIPVGTEVRFDGQLESAGEQWHLAGLGEVMRGVRIGDLDPVTPVPGLGVSIKEFFLGETALTDVLDEAAAKIRAGTAEAKGRRAPRILVGLPARWGPTWPPDREGYLSNVSSTGALVLTVGDALEPGAAIHVSVDLPVGREVSPMRTLATVTRLQEYTPIDGKGMGIEFAPVNPVERTLREVLTGSVDPAPQPAPIPDAVGRPDMDFSSMSARVEEPQPSALEALSETLRGTSDYQWKRLARILGLALLTGAILWLGFVCLDSFSG